MENYDDTILSLVKDRIGLRSNVRDNYLTFIIKGIIKELEDEKGLVIDLANPYHLMFIVDFSTWRYLNRDNMDGIPRHLQFRLHNLIIKCGVAK
ncbi:hypothetical protein KHA94_13475 [Bacillus sp. FJAT-49705]|uniref:Phage protein n=1 Tax=Cytobacillus citreus TaxID=2833586 RepID=A0ABS5NW85_9BACI|nr:hypothetical protein [Cytobacillus citreus]